MEKMIVLSNGERQWRDSDGKYHRENGPAIEFVNGTKMWFVKGELHREDGPACEYANGDKIWYVNGKRHRIDGPAIEYVNGDKYWYIEGKEYSEEEFNKKVLEMNKKRKSRD